MVKLRQNKKHLKRLHHGKLVTTAQPDKQNSIKTLIREIYNIFPDSVIVIYFGFKKIMHQINIVFYGLHYKCCFVKNIASYRRKSRKIMF